MLIVCLYVNDLICIGNDNVMFENFKKSMMVEFDIFDIGMMNYFLDIKVMQYTAESFISQKKYVREILDKFQMKNCNSDSTLIETGLKLLKYLERRKVNNTLYKQIVENWTNLTTTRLDIMHV